MSLLAQKYMKITLCVCTNREVKAKTLASLLELVNYSKEVDFHILVANRGYTISENRNYCVVQAQRNGSDYLFFVDDDMVLPEFTLEALLEHKKDVIGVNSYSRCLPQASTVGLMDKDGKYMHPDKHTAWEMRIPPSLFEAYFVGAGVMLIDMKVFNKIEKPYFDFTYDENGQVKNGEDGHFCDQVRKAGMKVWCDPTIEIGHLGEYEYKRGEELPLITKL
jgi:GT2 family glycosyltransferase